MESKNTTNTFIGFIAGFILLAVAAVIALSFILKQFAPKILAAVMATKLG